MQEKKKLAIEVDNVQKIYKLGRGVNARKGHQRFLGMETAHIANFSYELWAEGGANTKHLHHHRILRQRSRQGLHLLLKSS